MLRERVTPPRKLAPVSIEYFFITPTYLLPVSRLAQRCQSDGRAHIEDDACSTAVHHTVNVAILSGDWQLKCGCSS